jgi:RNA polymerase sigma factor (sigma-70 family)
MDLEDLVHEGIFGLNKAIDKYDITKNYRLSTYAVWYIRQTILRALDDKGRIIRLPFYINAELRTYIKNKCNLEQMEGRKLTVYELSDYLNIPVKNIEKYEEYISDTISYNYMIRDEENEELFEISSYLKNKESVEEKVDDSLFKEDIYRCIKNTPLTVNEIFVIIKRFGLNDNEMLTQEEIGKLLHLNKQRVCQIEKKAIEKLRKVAIKQDLKSYLHPEEYNDLKQVNHVSNNMKSIVGLDSYWVNFFDERGLTENEIKVYALSYGLFDKKEYDEDEISKRMDIMKEVVGDYKKSATNKLMNYRKKRLRKRI